jgi:hypothetical protein
MNPQRVRGVCSSCVPDLIRRLSSIASACIQNATRSSSGDWSRRPGLATLVFNLGPRLRVELADGSRGTYEAGDAFFSGPSETYAITETDCAQRGVQVSLTPLGARRLLGFPLDEIRDRLIDPTDLLGQSARRTM